MLNLATCCMFVKQKVVFFLFSFYFWFSGIEIIKHIFLFKRKYFYFLGLHLAFFIHWNFTFDLIQFSRKKSTKLIWQKWFNFRKTLPELTWLTGLYRVEFFYVKLLTKIHLIFIEFLIDFWISSSNFTIWRQTIFFF